MIKPKSLQSSILFSMIGSMIVILAVLGSYSVYDYDRELRANLQHSLRIVAEDLLHHQERPKGIEEHFREEYETAPFELLFDDLSITISSEILRDSERSVVVKEIADGQYLNVSANSGDLREKVKMYVVKIILLFSAVLIVFALFLYFLLIRLFSPLRCLVAYCQEPSKDDPSTPLCSGSSEIDELREAIKGLVTANQTLCQQKQDIFKEAAHEIKSPLAILKARLALFKQNDTIAKATFIQESEDDIKTISHKLRELLFLKEIEWEMLKRQERISMQSQCLLMQEAFRPILEKKGLKMVSNWEEDFSLVVHKEAMQKVMQAIFENIFMHTKNHTTIHNYVDTKAKSLHIVNAMGEKSDETLFSSYIGSKMIARLADKLNYTYHVEAREGKFYTTITFER